MNHIHNIIDALNKFDDTPHGQTGKLLDQMMKDAEVIKRLRTEQTEAVMPLIGPLLDAWEFMSNDVKGYMREHCPNLCRCLTNIDNAMTGDAA